MTKKSQFNLWQKQHISHFSKAFTLALGPIKPPIKWVPRALPPGQSIPDTTHSHPSRAEIRSKWRYASYPHVPSWHAGGQTSLKERGGERGGREREREREQEDLLLVCLFNEIHNA